MAFNRTLKHFTSSQELATIWASGQNYILNQLVIESDKLYRCNLAHTSTSFQTDYASGDWVEVSDGLTPWATGRYYEQDQFVEESNKLYQCLVAHTSGTFATDLTAGKWVSLLPTTTAGDIIVHNGTDNVRQAIGSDGQVLVVDSAQTNKLKWATIQQGSKNYIPNSTFENGVTPPSSWSPISVTINATTKIPSGSTSADTTITLATSSSSPLAGTYSMVATTAGSTTITTTARGFISSAFTIDAEDKAKVMGFSFYYEPSGSNMNFSGTSSNTFAVYIRDVSGGAWIQPAGVYNMTQGSGSGLCSGTFQTTATGTQYQIVVLMISSVTGALSIKFDDFQVGPQKVVYGSPVTDWQSFTPTVSGISGTMTGKWRRVGDSAEFEMALTTSGTASGTITVSVTSAFAFDYTKLPVSAFANIGSASANDGTGLHLGTCFTDNTSTNSFFISGDDGQNVWNATVPFTWSGTRTVSFNVKVPLVGLSSSVQMSNDTDTRVISAQAACSTAFAYSATTPINFDSVAVDRAASITPSTTAWKFTAPVSGDYRISVGLLNSAGSLSVSIHKNGSPTAFRTLMSVTTAAVTSASTTITLNAGEYFDIRGASGATLLNDSKVNTISVERLSGPATIAASDTVAARYTSSGGQLISDNTYTRIDFANKVFDTTSSVTTGASWAFTAPISGKYQVNSKVTVNYVNDTSYTAIKIQKNLSDYSVSQRFWQASGAGAVFPSVAVISDIVECVAGDTITIWFLQNTAGARNLTTTATENTVSIVRVGN